MEPGFSSDVADFDFDVWRLLAERDPQAFVRERRRLIDHFIAGSGEHAKDLAALQERIDTMRAIAGGPTLAMRALASMMEKRLRLLSAQLKDLHTELEGFGTSLNRVTGHATDTAR